MIPEIESLSSRFQSRVETKRISLDFQTESTFRITSSLPDTFSVEVGFEDGKYVVRAGGWHGQFEDAEQARAVSTWLLTPYYRIAQSVRGNGLLSTWLEIYTETGWEGTEYVYFVDPSTISSPAEDADEIHIFQQAIFLDSAFTTYYPGAHLDDAGYPLGTILGKTVYVKRDDGWYPIGVPEAE